MEREYGVRWLEFNRYDQIVEKQLFFATDDSRDKFLDKLMEKDSFYQIVAYSNPK